MRLSLDVRGALRTTRPTVAALATHMQVWHRARMKRRALIIACVLPILPLWLLLIHLAEKKYPIVSAKEYWESRLEGRPEFFHLDGYVWFAPKWVYLHGYWPRRVREKDAENGILSSWNDFVSNLIGDTNQWGTNVVQKLNSLTGANCGNNQSGWLKWKSEHAFTKEQVLSFLPPPSKDPELQGYFRFHVQNRIWFATFEALFFSSLWATFLVLSRVRLKEGLPSIKWGIVSWFLSFLAFAPWLCNYGMGAFTTWQGPDVRSYSGSYLWRGDFHYGNSIAYRTFVEILGTPPLWCLQHFRFLRFFDNGQFGVFIWFCLFYAVTSFVIAFSVCRSRRMLLGRAVA